MALEEATLKTNLLGLFNAMKKAPVSEEDYAAKLAKIINDHIKTAAVTVEAGIAVSTSGGGGVTTAPGAGSLS
jgi:translation initiation factor 2 alpha subunit (eIF-2alpha)